MKTVYLIGGTMGVGKTTVCRELQKALPNSVFLDGDWCWDAQPFQVNEETKAMVLQNICFLLNQFIRCSVYESIVFCWVLHEQRILDAILERLDSADCQIKAISLVCSQATLRERLKKDIAGGVRTADVVERSLAKLPLYNQLDTVKVDTDNRSVKSITEQLLRLDDNRLENTRKRNAIGGQK